MGTPDQPYGDGDRGKFLRVLDCATEIDLTEWELDFLGNRLGQMSFTPKQRAVIDELIDKYGERIGF